MGMFLFTSGIEHQSFRLCLRIFPDSLGLETPLLGPTLPYVLYLRPISFFTFSQLWKIWYRKLFLYPYATWQCYHDQVCWSDSGHGFHIVARAAGSGSLLAWWLLRLVGALPEELECSEPVQMVIHCPTALFFEASIRALFDGPGVDFAALCQSPENDYAFHIVIYKLSYPFIQALFFWSVGTPWGCTLWREGPLHWYLHSFHALLQNHSGLNSKFPFLPLH